MVESTIISVYVTPRSGRDVVTGLRRNPTGIDEVCVRVTVPPDKGRANKAVCKTVAASLGIPKTAVLVVSGQTSRHKRLAIDVDAKKVFAWIALLPSL